MYKTANFVAAGIAMTMVVCFAAILMVAMGENKPENGRPAADQMGHGGMVVSVSTNHRERLTSAALSVQN